jgi:hypothetical protein
MVCEDQTHDLLPDPALGVVYKLMALDKGDGVFRSKLRFLKIPEGGEPGIKRSSVLWPERSHDRNLLTHERACSVRRDGLAHHLCMIT